MNLRFAYSRVTGRGVGLGNELIPWARAFVASTVLGARLLPPAFGLNARRYWRHFGTPRHDWISQRLLAQALPTVNFDERAFLDYGGDQLSSAISAHAEAHGLMERSAYLWTTSGMWGGYRHLAEAREFVRATLYQSRFAPGNLFRIRSRLDPEKVTVAMHMRLGDFQPAVEPADYRGRFNISLPQSWYQGIAEGIRRYLGDRVQFLIVSDGSPSQIEAIARPLNAVTTYDLPDGDCSDLLALAGADLLVCSVSSYSAWAAFLSDSPYLWFGPNLNSHDEGVYSIWGHEAEQKRPGGATSRAIASYLDAGARWQSRGIPISCDGQVSRAVLDELVSRASKRTPAGDLVCHGVVPISPDESAPIQQGRS